MPVRRMDFRGKESSNIKEERGVGLLSRRRAIVRLYIYGNEGRRKKYFS